jgi:hypothetical protein
MRTIGRIEAGSGGIDPGRWLALIESHPALGHFPPTMGINPFNEEPVELHSPATSANVSLDGTRLGTIWWPVDGSPLLFVTAEEGSAELLARVAKDVATALGAEFLPETAPC